MLILNIRGVLYQLFPRNFYGTLLLPNWQQTVGHWIWTDLIQPRCQISSFYCPRVTHSHWSRFDRIILRETDKNYTFHTKPASVGRGAGKRDEDWQVSARALSSKPNIAFYRLSPIIQPIMAPFYSPVGQWPSRARACHHLLPSAISILQTQSQLSIWTWQRRQEYTAVLKISRMTRFTLI